MDFEIDQDVHYVIPVGGAHCRAHIVNVLHYGKGIVSLFVVPEKDISSPPYFFTWNVTYSPDGDPGTWHYIEQKEANVA